MTPTLPAWLTPVSRVCFATAVAFFGVQHLLYGEFVTRIVPAWPAWVPARGLWPYLVGLLLLSAALAILSGRKARPAAMHLGTFVLAGALLFALPAALADHHIGIAWTNAGKAFALGGGAWLVAATLPAAGPPGMADAARVAIGRISFAGFLIVCGVQHFLWLPYVTPLVPAWIPGAVFWAEFAGVALIAGGIGLLVPRTARLAARLTGAMIFAWLILLHIPRALADLHNANESTAVFEALAMSGIAFLLAALSAARPAAAIAFPARAPVPPAPP